MSFVPGSGSYETSIDHSNTRKTTGRNVSELSKSVNAVRGFSKAGCILTGGSVLSTSRNCPASSFGKSLRRDIVPREARNSPSPS